jgi:hypothetical protein
MLADMTLDNFRNQAVERAPAGCCLLQHGRAACVFLKRAFDCLQLTAEPYIYAATWQIDRSIPEA